MKGKKWHTLIMSGVLSAVVQNVSASDETSRGPSVEEYRKAYITDVARRITRSYRPGKFIVSKNAVITCTITSNGTPSNPKILQSSGSSDFDSYCLNLTKRAAPYRPFTTDLNLEISFPPNSVVSAKALDEGTKGDGPKR